MLITETYAALLQHHVAFGALNNEVYTPITNSQVLVFYEMYFHKISTSTTVDSITEHSFAQWHCDWQTFTLYLTHTDIL